MHEFASTQHTINPPLLLSSIPNCSRSVPAHTFVGNQDSMMEEYLEDSAANDSVESLVHSESSVHPEPSVSGTVLSPSATRSNIQTETPQSARPSSRKRTSNDLVMYLKKEDKRRKKETQHFFQMMAAFGKACNVELPEYTPSSDSDD